MTVVIQVQGVCKRFSRQPALDNVSLNVPSGVVFALLGENGAGKSTLIRSLLGYHRVDKGNITVCGLDPVQEPMKIRRRVGYVSDAPAFYDWMTVANAGWYASGFYPNGFLKNYQTLIHDFQLPADQKIRKLSKGMRAKVALSLAMAFEPELLILDEPTSGLDPHVRRTFMESMIDRAASGQTVFLSSHQIHEVERVADWIAILHQGKLQVVAPLEQLKSDISMLDFSLRDPFIALPSELDQLSILHKKVSGRTSHLMVRGLTPTLESSLTQNANLFEVKSYRPNLEEIYLGFTQPSQSNDSTRDSDRAQANNMPNSTEVA